MLLVNPFSNFPLNDDWAFGKSVSYLVNDGQIKFTDWQSMTLIAHVFWGALFCLPFGFSFVALRVSTLFLSLLGVFLVYFLMREIGANRNIAFFSALLILVNPFYFVLSNSFMTDVPFFTFLVLSLLFFFKGMRDDRYSMILFGVLFSLIAVFIRQIAVVIPISFAAIYTIKNAFKSKVIAIASFIVFFEIGSLILYQRWLQISQRLPKLYYSRTNDLLNLLNIPLHKTLIQFFYNFAIASIYIGFFVFPFLLLIPIREIKNIIIKMNRLYLVVSLFIIGALISLKRIMPITTNILYDFGIGPVLTRDINILGHKYLPSAPQFFWIFITIIGILGGAFIVCSITAPLINSSFWGKRIDFLSSRWEILFFVLIFFLYFLPLGLTWFLDRYLIPLFLLIMVIIFMKYKPLFVKTNFAVWILLFLIAVFTVGGGHDYFSWNKARWKALNYLTHDLKISSKKIDGGFEFNGVYNFDFNYINESHKGKSWWWVYDDKYMIAFGPVKGFKKFREYEYNRWMPYGTGKIYILKKK